MTFKTKIASNIGKSCYVAGGAIAGLPIGGIIGMGIGAVLGMVFGHVLEKSMNQNPLEIA